MKQSTRAQLVDISTAIVIASLVFVPLFWLGYDLGPILGISVLLAIGVLMIRLALRRTPDAGERPEPD